MQVHISKGKQRLDLNEGEISEKNRKGHKINQAHSEYIRHTAVMSCPEVWRWGRGDSGLWVPLLVKQYTQY